MCVCVFVSYVSCQVGKLLWADLSVCVCVCVCVCVICSCVCHMFPQATQMQMLSSPLNLFHFPRNRADSSKDFILRLADPVAVVIIHF